MKQLPLALTPPPEPCFENFVAGAGAAAQALLQQLVTQFKPGVATSSVYLWGEAGSGKTHLLQAVALALQQKGLRSARLEGGDVAPWPTDPLQADCAAVLIDRCDELSDEQQHAAFTLYNRAAGRGLIFVAAGHLPPADLALRDDLRSRLGWGDVFALQPLSDTDTWAALQAEALRRGFDFPQEVGAFLMQRFARDLGTQMALLAALDAHGLATGRRLTTALVRDWLAQSPAAHEGADGLDLTAQDTALDTTQNAAKTADQTAPS